MTNKIVLMKDIIDSKERKEKELKFYKTKLKDLHFKINMLEKDVRLTNTIIKLIESEELKEI